MDQVERLESELQVVSRKQALNRLGSGSSSPRRGVVNDVRPASEREVVSSSSTSSSSGQEVMKTLVRREQELIEVIDRQGLRLRRRPSWSFFFIWLFLASMGCCIYGYMYGIHSGHGTRFCAVDAYRETF